MTVVIQKNAKEELRVSLDVFHGRMLINMRVVNGRRNLPNLGRAKFPASRLVISR